MSHYVRYQQALNLLVRLSQLLSCRSQKADKKSYYYNTAICDQGILLPGTSFAITSCQLFLNRNQTWLFQVSTCRFPCFSRLYRLPKRTTSDATWCLLGNNSARRCLSAMARPGQSDSVQNPVIDFIPYSITERVDSLFFY
jgi:hypothetical protein